MEDDQLGSPESSIDDRDRDSDGEEEVLELSPKAQRLALGLLCFHDFTVGVKHLYIEDPSVLFILRDFLIRQPNPKDFLLYTLNYTSFFSSEVCLYFNRIASLFPSTSPDNDLFKDMINAKNLEYLNDEANNLTEEQVKIAKISLDNYMSFVDEGLPRGNNLVFFKRLNLSNQELLIICSRCSGSTSQTMYLDLISKNLTTDDANHYLLNDYQVDHIIKKWPIEKYIDYLAMFADNNLLKDQIIVNVEFKKWSAAPDCVRNVVGKYSARVILMIYKEYLTQSKK